MRFSANCIKFFFTLALCLIISLNNFATTYYSYGNTAPNLTTSWGVNSDGTGANPSNFTTAGDIFIVRSGNSMTTGANWLVTGSLTINSGGIITFSGYTVTVGGTTNISGTLNVSSTTGTKTLSGNVTLTSTGVINFSSTETLSLSNNLTLNSGSSIDGSAIGVLNVGGTLNINSGGTSTIGAITMTVTGATTIDGTLNLSSNTGVKTFAGVTIELYGAFTSTAITATGNLIFKNGIINNGGNNANSFVAGGATFNTYAQSLSGNSNFNFAGIVTVTTITLTSNSIVNMTCTGAGTLAGTGNWTQAANSYLYYYGSTMTVTTLTATSSPNTVDYYLSGTQTIKGTTYFNLNCSGNNTKALGANTTINGEFKINAGATYNPAGSSLTVNGITSVYGTSAETNTGGTDTYVGKVTIYPGGVWNYTVNETPFFGGGLEFDGASFTSGTGLYTFQTNSQTISGSQPFTIAGNVTITGAITVVNTNGLTIGGVLNGSVASSTLDNQGLLYYQSATAPMATGVLLCTTITPNTVCYNLGGTQAVKGTTYNNLQISTSGTKTLNAAATITGNLTIDGTATLADGSFQITGNSSGTVSIASGATLQIGAGGATTETFPTNFISSNINLASGATVTYNTTDAQTISSLFSYKNLTITGNSTKTADGALTVTGNITVNTNATFSDGGYQITGNGTGTFTLTAGANLILGTAASATSFPTDFTTGNISFASTSTVTYNSNASQNISNAPVYGNLTLSCASAASRNASGDLTVSGILTIGTNISLNDNGHTITAQGNVVNNGTHSGTGKIYMNGGLAVHAVSGNPAVFGNLELNDANGATLTSAGTTVINGTLTVTQGTLTLNAFTTSLTVSGETNVGIGATSGILKIAVAGTRTFSNAVTIGANGTWNNSSNSAISIAGDLTVNAGATFTAGTGVYTFSGAGKTIGGTITALSIPSLTATGTISNGIEGLTVGTALSGSGSFTQNTNSVLYIGGTLGVTNFDATTSPNTVCYNKTNGAQNVRATTYDHLTIDKSGQTATLLTPGITVNSDLTITTGTLELSSFNITVTGNTTVTGTIVDNSATGTNTFNGDVTVNGTVSNTGNSAMSIVGNLTVNTGATFTAGTGTYTFSGTSKTIGGTIAALSIPTLTATGTISNSIAGLTVGTALSGSGSFTQNTSSVLYIGGTLGVSTFNATASPNTVCYNSTTASQTVISTTYHNLTINKSSQTASLTSGITVNGDLTISTGTLSDAGNTITLLGSWNNSGTYSTTGKLLVSGSSLTQGLSGSTTFNNLTINKSAGDFTLNSSITISASLSLNSGNLITGSSNSITFGTSASSPNEITSSRIVGKAIMSSRSVGVNSLNFLGANIAAGSTIGNVSLTRVTGTAGTITANSHSGIMCNWNITVGNQASRNITFSWFSSYDNGHDFSSRYAQVWNSPNKVTWSYIGNSALTFSDPRSISVSATTIPAWWTVSSTDAPLPVHLISFDAKVEDAHVNLDWTTASELNNNFFTIEKSNNFVNWTIFENIVGAGNSNSLINYEVTDFNPFADITYYRLSQTDFNGNNEELGVKAVSLKSSYITHIQNIYPNPATESTSCSVISEAENVSYLKVINSIGQILLNEQINLQKGLNTIPINLSGIARNYCIVIIEGADGSIIAHAPLIIK